MDRGEQLATEFKALQSLCDDKLSRQERQELLDSLGSETFTMPEHQIVFESLRTLFPRGPISEERLRVHLNNRGFPDTDVEKYFRPGSDRSQPNHGFSKPLAVFAVLVVTVAGTLVTYGSSLRRIVRESLMQRVTSAHYEVLSPAGALSQDAMREFAARRETLFSALDKKLADADSNTEVRVVFDPQFSAPKIGETGQPPYSVPYSVSGVTIRTELDGHNPQLPAAADAEAMLSAAWGKPGNAKLARWTAIWLTGDWHGAEIGMAAAQTEQRLGHKQVDVVLGNPGGQISSADDQTLLGAAWISEVAELAGPKAVRKLYSSKMPKLTVEEVTRVLGTNPLELDRRWQLWMYAYLAGMPAMLQGSDMHMNMPMSGMEMKAPMARNP